MKKVAVVVGHTAVSPGSQHRPSGTIEFEYNRHVGEALHHALLATRRVDSVVVYRDEPDDYRNLPDKVNATGADLALELHLNAHERADVRGMEVAHWYNSRGGIQFAQRLVASMSTLLPSIPVRRVNGLLPIRAGERGWWFLAKTRMPACLVEPGFISNDDDRDTLLVEPGTLVQAYLDAIIETMEVI